MEHENLTVGDMIDRMFDSVLDEYAASLYGKSMLNIYPSPDFEGLPKFQQRADVMSHPKVFGKSHRPKRK